MKIRQVVADFLHAGSWTDITKLIVAFRNFANTPKIYTVPFYVQFVIRFIKYDARNCVHARRLGNKTAMARS